MWLKGPRPSWLASSPRGAVLNTRVGDYAVELLGRQTKALVKWHGPVVEHQEVEALHQMRVSMRRMRTTVNQFGPALLLPKGVGDKSITRSLRRLGMARDLDVLAERFDQVFLPQLPKGEIKQLKPVLRQLRRERQQAYGELVALLQSPAHLGLLAQLQGWLKQPSFKGWGETPLANCLWELQLPALGELFLHGGWYLDSEEVAGGNGDGELIHDLRKQIKGVRYGLENLKPIAGRRLRRFIGQLKQGQELLGEYNDLAVLQQAIDGQINGGMEQVLPQLAWLIAEHRRSCWLQWRNLASELARAGQRRALVGAVLADQGRLGRRIWWQERLGEVGRLCPGLHRGVI